MGATIRFRKVSRSDPDENYVARLDVYNKGSRSYECTKLYTTRDYFGKKHIKPIDREVMAILQQRKKEIDLEIMQRTYNFAASTSRRVDFLKFFEQVCEKKGHPTYTHTLKKLREFSNGKHLSFGEFGHKRIQEFTEFVIASGCGNTTAHEYLKRVSIVYNEAVREGLTDKNPVSLMPRHDKPKPNRAERVYLTIEEVKRLNNTSFPHQNKQIGIAFLFGCFTGLRISDLKKLKHTEIEDGYLKFRQQKSSSEVLYLPLHESATAILERVPKAEDSNKVFHELLTGNGYMCNQLRLWAARAGITKNITWHTARHTFACNWLANEGDIFYLSKYLGHSSVAITERYAHVLPKKLVSMVNKIPAL